MTTVTDDSLRPIFDLANALERTLEISLQTHDLSVANVRLLRYVRDAQDNDAELTPTLLASLLVQKVHSVSGMLNRLEARGLLLRRPDPQDGRQVYVGITFKGRETLTAADLIYADLARRVSLASGATFETNLTKLAQLALETAGVSLARRRDAIASLGEVAGVIQ